MSRARRLLAQTGQGGGRSTFRTPTRSGSSFRSEFGGGDADFSRAEDTRSPVPSAAAERRIEEAKQEARTLLATQGDLLSGDERERLLQIANQGFESESSGVSRVLGYLGRPFSLVSAAVVDAAGGDTRYGREITGRDYMNILLGRSASIQEDLGPDIAGDDGRFSGSQLLKLAGWDESETWPGKIARFGAQAVLEIGLDPLSYVSFGTLGLGPKVAGDLAEAGVRTAAREALEAVARDGIEEVSDRYVRKLADDIAELADSKVDEILAAAKDDFARNTGREASGADLDILFQEAREQAITDAGAEVRRVETNSILESVSKKEFSTLAERNPEWVRSRHAHPATTGGITLTLPFGRKRLVSGIKLGGRTDRAITRPIRAAWEKGSHLVPQDVRRMVGSLGPRLSFEKATLQARRAGHASAFDDARRQAEAMLDTLEVTDMPYRFSALLTNLRSKADQVGEDADEVLRKMSNLLERPTLDDLQPGSLFADSGLDALARDVHSELRANLDKLLQAYRGFNPKIGNIEGYFPRIATKEFKDLVEQTIDLAIDPANAPEDLRLGYELLSEYSAAAGRKAAAAGSADPGAFRFSRERSIGRSALFPTISPDLDLALIGRPGALLGGAQPVPGFIPLEILNEQMAGALEDVLRRAGRLPRGLADDFVPFDDNIATALDTYVSALSQSVAFHAMVEKFTEAGLILGRDTEIDMQRILYRMTEDITPQTISDLDKVLQRLSARKSEVLFEALPTEAVELAPNWTIDVPVDVLKDPKVQTALRKTRRKVERAIANVNQVQQDVEVNARRMIKEGVPDVLAYRIARSQSQRTLNLAKGAMTQAASRQIKTLHEGVAEALRFADPGNPQPIVDAITAVRDRANQITRAVRRAIQKMDDEWARRFPATEDVVAKTVDLTGVDNNGRPILMTMADQIDEAINARLRAMVDEGILDPTNPELVRVAGLGREALASYVQKYEVDAIVGRHNTRLKESIASHIISAGVDMPEQYAGVQARHMDDAFFTDEDVLTAYVEATARRMGKTEVDDEAAEAAETALSALYAMNEQLAHVELQNLPQGLLGDLNVGDIRQGTLVAMRSNDPAALIPRSESLGRLLMFIGLDPAGLEVDAAARKIRYNFARTVEHGPPPTMDSVLTELRAAIGDDSRVLTSDDLFAISLEMMQGSDEFASQLSSGVRRLLEESGGEVPFEMRALRGLDEWFANATAVRDVANQNLREVRKVDLRFRRLNEAWGEVREELDRAFRTGRVRPRMDALWDQHRAVLRNGLPPEQYHRISYAMDLVKARQSANIPRRALQRNLELADGTLWAPSSQAVENFKGLTEEVESMLRQKQYQHIRAQLEEIRQFQDSFAVTLGDALRQTEEGQTILAENFRLFGDEAFKQQFGDVRRRARRISKNLERMAADEAYAEDREFIMRAAQRFGFAKDWKLTQGVTEINNTYGFVPFSSVGVGGEALQGQIGEANVALLLDNMVRNMGAMYTPEGIRLLRENTSAVTRWWKAMVTVARPTFVPRNLLGGIWNNQIIDVGARDYIFVGNNMARFRRYLRQGMEPAEAIQKMPEKFRPYMEGLQKSGLLDTSFSSTFEHIRSGDVDRWLSPQTLNPFNVERFGLVRAGGKAMETSEDFLRAAAFVRHYDPLNPETLETAKQLALAVHFDYNHLTELERNIKKFIPFFVWSRRNLPLQLRTLIEQPGVMQRYSHLMQSAEDNFGDDRYDYFPGSQYWSGMQVGTSIILNDGTPFWARVMLDPDLPVGDLETVLSFNPVSPSSWKETIASFLGPQYTLPFDLAAQEDYSDVNAPAGLNAILRTLDRLGVFSESIVVSEEGDAQIPRWMRQFGETGLGWVPEWAGVTGGFAETDPRRRQELGFTDEDPTAADRLRAAGLRLGRAFGVQVQTPAQTPSNTFEASEYVREVKNRLRLEEVTDEDS